MSARPDSQVAPLLDFHAQAAEREAARRRKAALDRAAQLVAQAEYQHAHGNTAAAGELIDQAIDVDAPMPDDAADADPDGGGE